MWSKQQNDIFSWFKSGNGNLVVRARAGTGKTTTILEAIKHVNNGKTLLAAFNKSIATELQSKLNGASNVEAQTLHSLGFKFILKNAKVRVDNFRGENLAIKAGAPKEIAKTVAKLAGLVKNTCLDLSEECAENVAYDFNIAGDDCGYSEKQLASYAVKAAKLALDLSDGCIDFDDMLFVPVQKGWVRAYWDLVVIDEAQDMNQIQLNMAMKAVKKGGRVCVVGDDRQAIYGFRGADSNAIDRLKDALNAIEMGLTTTYRCPKLVVGLASALVPDYSVAETAPDGIVDDCALAALGTTAQAGDFVLSRANAPLVGACLAILRAGKPAKVAGKDIAKTLLNLTKKWADKGLDNFVVKLGEWREREIKKADALPENRRDAKKMIIDDQVETILMISEDCEDIKELRSRIENLFVDEAVNPNGIVLCSTIHKAKGMEKDRVFILRNTLYPGKRKGIEEQNLEYVAITRAKKHLTWVE